MLQASKLLAHWLLQSQQSYSDRFRNSSTHHLEASVEEIDDDGASCCCNISGEMSTSCAGINGEECLKAETCSVLKSPRSGNLEIDDNCQSSPPENIVDSISLSILGMENGKDEEIKKSSQTLNGS